MLDMMKGLMKVLKYNYALKFAVVTGCLSIAKESIFTGTINFVSDSVADSRLTEYFGFIQSEVCLLYTSYAGNQPINKICCGPNVDDYEWTKKVMATCFDHCEPCLLYTSRCV